MKALGLVVSDKKIFENCILKTYFLTPWPTYATNWNGLNNFDRGPPRHHSCEVWSKSNKRFQRRCCLKKLLTHAWTDGRTDDGRRTMGHHKSSQNIHSLLVVYKVFCGGCPTALHNAAMDIQALREICESDGNIYINLFKTIQPIELSVKLCLRNITQRSAANALKTRFRKKRKMCHKRQDC